MQAFFLSSLWPFWAILFRLIVQELHRFKCILFTIHICMWCYIRDTISRLAFRLNRWQSCLIRLLVVRWHDDTSLSLRYFVWLLTTHLIHLSIFLAATRVELYFFFWYTFELQVDNVVWLDVFTESLNIGISSVRVCVCEGCAFRDGGQLKSLRNDKNV